MIGIDYSPAVLTCLPPALHTVTLLTAFRAGECVPFPSSECAAALHRAHAQGRRLPATLVVVEREAVDWVRTPPLWPRCNTYDALADACAQLGVAFELRRAPRWDPMPVPASCGLRCEPLLGSRVVQWHEESPELSESFADVTVYKTCCRHWALWSEWNEYVKYTQEHGLPRPKFQVSFG